MAGKKKKKPRAGTIIDEDENAVDVFGGAGMSQEELLAQALGETEAPEAKPKKTKKKPKKGAVIDEDENAVDVFGGAGMTQDELLAQALGETDAPAAKPKKSKKKAKKGTVIDEDENAVDVFGGQNVDPETLLAEALGDPGDDKSAKKKQKKSGKGNNEPENSNAVEVFAPEDVSQEELLAAALGDAPSQKKKKKKKKTRGANADSANDDPLELADSDEHSRSAEAVDNLPDLSTSRNPSAEQLGPDLAGKDSEAVASESKVVTAPSAASDSATSLSTEPIDNETDSPVEEEFEPDQEVISEFEDFSTEVGDFTLAGRRKASKSKRKERNEEEMRFSDARRAKFGSGGEKFTSVRLEDVGITFRNTTVLNGVTWGVRTGERVGLVGQNGCGKTTQLRMIAGQLKPDEGEILRSSTRTKASFLRQEFVDELDPSRTLREELLSAFGEESKLLQEYQDVEKAVTDAGEDLEALESLLNKMETLRLECESKDAWNLDSRIDKVLPGLGFIEEDNDKLVASFSGGWKVRIGLAKVLLQDPDLLLLDEPSNHLDLNSVEWLEEYLCECNLPMVIVSHDREFINRVCTKIVEIEGGEAFEYPGNYTSFVKQKAERRKAWEAAYERQSKFIKEQNMFIKRNKMNPNRVGQVKSRQKMLERMERTGQMVRQPPRGGKPLVFRFPPAPRSGRDVIVVDEVTHGYEDKVLFEDASIAIERGDRMAIVGPNGSGKSTLLRLITGQETAQSGTVECASLYQVKLAYFEQNQADALDLTITVLDTMKGAAPSDWTYEQLRALLGKFLFKGDSVNKLVEALSGGEKARLALAKMMLEPANVMVLDEPTNHIDAGAMDMLEEALQAYDGTLVVVSHDRYFVSQVANQILYIEDQEVKLHDGDYKSFMEKNKRIKEVSDARVVSGSDGIKSAPKVSFDEPLEETSKKQKRKKNFGGSGVTSGKTKEMNAKRWA